MNVLESKLFSKGLSLFEVSPLGASYLFNVVRALILIQFFNFRLIITIELRALYQNSPSCQQPTCMYSILWLQSQVYQIFVRYYTLPQIFVTLISEIVREKVRRQLTPVENKGLHKIVTG